MQPGSGAQPLEPDTEANAHVVDALVVLSGTGVRDVVDHHRYLPHRIDAIAEFQGFAEQDVRAEAFAVRLAGDLFAVIQGAAEKDASSDPIAGLDDIAEQLPGPGRAEIELIGIAG